MLTQRCVATDQTTSANTSGEEKRKNTNFSQVSFTFSFILGILVTFSIERRGVQIRKGTNLALFAQALHAKPVLDALHEVIDVLGKGCERQPHIRSAWHKRAHLGSHPYDALERRSIQLLDRGIHLVGQPLRDSLRISLETNNVREDRQVQEEC